jgi:hypothetical protein
MRKAPGELASGLGENGVGRVGHSRLRERVLHHRFVADVDHERQGLAAGVLDFIGGGMVVPRSFGCGSEVFAAIAMLAPSRAPRNAIASPMPREAPVMKGSFRQATSSAFWLSCS